MGDVAASGLLDAGDLVDQGRSQAMTSIEFYAVVPAGWDATAAVSFIARFRCRLLLESCDGMQPGSEEPESGRHFEDRGPRGY